MSATYRAVPGRLAAVALLSFLSCSFAVSLKGADAGHGAGGPALNAGEAFKDRAAMAALLHTATEPAKTAKTREKFVGWQTGGVGSRERFAGLQRGVAKAGSAAVQGVAKAGSAAVQGVAKEAPVRAPQRFLTQKELGPIMSVRCLHEKQRNPHMPCSEQGSDQGRFELGTLSSNSDFGPLSIGHYPHYKQRICHSNQEFFCDPTKLLSVGSQEKSTEQLRLFRERTLVNCGQLDSILDPDAERRPYEKRNPVFQGRHSQGSDYGRLGLEDYREFNLAVVLADEWPNSIRDTASMQTFGWRVMADWGLQPIYNGVDNGNPVNEYRNTWDGYRANCPTTAVLIILPRYKQAYLTSPSCEFICQTRGGPEVVAATLAALDKGGLEAAISAGIKQVHKVLDVTTLKSITKARDFSDRGVDGSQHGESMPWRRKWSDRTVGNARSESTTIGIMQFLYALLIFASVFSIVAVCYFMCQPDNLKDRRSRHLLASDVDRTWVRQTIREELNCNERT